MGGLGGGVQSSIDPGVVVVVVLYLGVWLGGLFDCLFVGYGWRGGLAAEGEIIYKYDRQ